MPSRNAALASGKSRNAGRVRIAADVEAWPLSWRSSRGSRVPPSAYVAKTHGGLGVQGRPALDTGPAPIPIVNATGTGGRPGRGTMS